MCASLIGGQKYQIDDIFYRIDVSYSNFQVSEAIVTASTQVESDKVISWTTTTPPHTTTFKALPDDLGS
jgi:hypothetical protein